MTNITRITVFLNEKPLQCEVTKYTTCDDVIEMALYSVKEKTAVDSYGLFESVHGVEKMATRNALVMKLIRSYGTDSSRLSLHIRKLESFKKRLPSLSLAKRKMKKLLAKRNLAEQKKCLDTILDNNLLNNYVNSKDKLYKKDIKLTKRTNDQQDNKAGKLVLMKRYLSDVTARFHDNEYSKSGGTDKPEEFISKTKLNVTYSIAGLECLGRNMAAVSEGDIDDLDTAFIEDYVELDNFTKHDELNECVLYDDEASDIESAFYDSLDEYSEDQVEASEDDIEKYNRNEGDIRHMLEKVQADVSSYDKAMESFMITLVNNDNVDDEGLSSMSSEGACL